MKEKKGNKFRAPENKQEALELALHLSLTAPSNEDMIRMVRIAIALANDMSDAVLLSAMKTALKTARLQIERESSELH